MFKRILIANRGEIALRIIRACKELGVETVLVYSEADKNAMYLNLADYKICIGAGPAGKSYLDITRIMSAAEIADVEAIHPGYGFLSENGDFAEICESSKIVFIGPSSRVLNLCGAKAQTREIAKKIGIPVLPGSGTLKDEKEAIKISHDIGFPVIIKASAGGGGRGMRISHNDISLVNNFMSAQSEAQASFNDGSLYIEKYIEKARHIEVQIMADNYGHVVHLGERDCTLQRRHQKLVEESPSPALTPKLREEITKAAVAFAKGTNYNNLGTIEFLLAPDGKFYLIEVNARIQVEHPVTESVTGIDLVKEQIRLASGERLRFSQKEIKFSGSAIECRINAEDPFDGFRPSCGKILFYNPPGGKGVRVDSHIYTGYEMPPFYDSLIAKVITHSENRYDAMRKMKRALNEMKIDGVKTTLPLCLSIFDDANFIRGDVYTTFIEESYYRR